MFGKSGQRNAEYSQLNLIFSLIDMRSMARKYQRKDVH